MIRFFFPFTAIPCHDFQQAPIFSYFYIAEYSSPEKQVSLPFSQLRSEALLIFSVAILETNGKRPRTHKKKPSLRIVLSMVW